MRQFHISHADMFVCIGLFEDSKDVAVHHVVAELETWMTQRLLKLDSLSSKIVRSKRCRYWKRSKLEKYSTSHPQSLQREHLRTNFRIIGPIRDGGYNWLTSENYGSSEKLLLKGLFLGRRNWLPGFVYPFFVRNTSHTNLRSEFFLPSELLWVLLGEKARRNYESDYRCRVGGGEPERRRIDEGGEEEWCADSLWPFSLLHQ